MHKKKSTTEIWNTVSHAIGVILFLYFSYLLVQKANDGRETAAYLIFALSNILLFGSSASYHAFSDRIGGKWLQVIDHVAIYLLIAGTYTPFLAISLRASAVGLPFLIGIWIVAIIGIIAEIFLPNRFPKLRVVLYLLMGWSILLIMPEVLQLIDHRALYWLVAGGLAYTVGVIFYQQKTKPWAHVIWHFFVLVAAILMFISIYYYI